jgi:hypothetical protein
VERLCSSDTRWRYHWDDFDEQFDYLTLTVLPKKIAATFPYSPRGPWE